MARPKLVVKVAAEEWVPYTILHNDTGKLVASGPMMNFLLEFCRILGASYVLLRPPDGLWGNVLPNGSSNGMLGMLLRGEADFALGPFVGTDNRERVADLTVPCYYDFYSVFYKRPALSIDPAGIVKTFTPQVWLLVAACGVVVGALLMATTRAAEKRLGSTGASQVSRAAQWTFQALVQQTPSWLPQDTSSQLLVGTWMLYGLVLTSVYKGIITAMLTLPTITIPIDSIADLAEQHDMPWKLEYGLMKEVMMASDDKAIRKVGAGTSGIIPSCWEARHEIRDGEFASICNKISVASIMSWDFRTTGRCHLYLSRHVLFGGLPISMLFPPNSSLFPKVNDIIMRLTEASLWDVWMARQITNTSECLKPPHADHDAVKPLSLQDIRGLLVLLAAGLSVSLLVFMGEMIYCASNKRGSVSRCTE